MGINQIIKEFHKQMIEKNIFLFFFFFQKFDYSFLVFSNKYSLQLLLEGLPSLYFLAIAHKHRFSLCCQISIKGWMMVWCSAWIPYCMEKDFLLLSFSLSFLFKDAPPLSLFFFFFEFYSQFLSSMCSLLYTILTYFIPFPHTACPIWL